MDNYTNEFEDTKTTAAEKRRVQEFDDLQNELSGNDVGRISRFLSADARAMLLEKRNGKSAGGISALDLLLLNNPAYAKIYGEAMDKLANYEDAAERVLDKLDTQLQSAETDFQTSLNNAATLSDGRNVFRDASRQVWDEHKKRIDEETAATIEWRGSEPDYEAYLEQKKNVQDLKNSIHETRVYQTDVLGTLREKLTDQNNPLSVDEIKDALSKAETRVPEAVKAETHNSSVPAIDHTQSSNIAIPELN